ncbi:ATP-grasp domain-containing protein [Mannheimia haemolytica]
MNILILEPIGSGAALVNAALDMNWNCYLLSYNQSDRKLPEHSEWRTCQLIEVDTNNDDEVIKYLNKLNLKFDVIVSGNEYYVPLSIKLAKIFNLNRLPDELINISHNKLEMRKHLQNLGIRNPWFKTISNKDEIKKQNWIFPCVIKPKDCAGSFHVNKVNNISELEYYYELSQENSHKELGHTIGNEMLIEEYLNPPEYSVEGYFSDGIFHLSSITKKFLSQEPYFVEIGHITPSYDLSDRQNQSIIEYIKHIINALHVNIGVIHAEIRFDMDNNPVLVEIAFRLPGDRIVDLIKISKNIDLAKAMLCSYANIPYKPECNTEKTYAGIGFLYNFKTKKDLDFLLSQDDYVYSFITKNTNNNLKDYRDRNGFFIFKSKEVSNLLNKLELVWR